MSQTSAEKSIVRCLSFGLLFVALFAFFWWQFGAGPASFMTMLYLLGFAASVIQKRISCRHPLDQTARDEHVRHERVLSPVPTEAAKARAKLVWQFLGGLLYLAFISLLLTEFANGHFWIVFSAVTLGVVFTGVLLLIWATSWALRDNTRPNQFSISTLLLLTTVLAVYLGVTRLLADLSGEQLGAGDNTFLAAAVICLILTGISLPFLAFFMESLVWLAAWLVRRPWIQRWLRSPLSTETPPSRVEEEDGNRQ